MPCADVDADVGVVVQQFVRLRECRLVDLPVDRLRQTRFLGLREEFTRRHQAVHRMAPAQQGLVTHHAIVRHSRSG